MKKSTFFCRSWQSVLSFTMPRYWVLTMPWHPLRLLIDALQQESTVTVAHAHLNNPTYPCALFSRNDLQGTGNALDHLCLLIDALQHESLSL
jgi:hypothetical protein